MSLAISLRWKRGIWGGPCKSQASQKEETSQGPHARSPSRPFKTKGFSHVFTKDIFFRDLFKPPKIEITMILKVGLTSRVWLYVATWTYSNWISAPKNSAHDHGTPPKK